MKAKRLRLSPYEIAEFGFIERPQKPDAVRVEIRWRVSLAEGFDNASEFELDARACGLLIRKLQQVRGELRQRNRRRKRDGKGKT